MVRWSANIATGNHKEKGNSPFPIAVGTEKICICIPFGYVLQFVEHIPPCHSISHFSHMKTGNTPSQSKKLLLGAIVAFVALGGGLAFIGSGSG